MRVSTGWSEIHQKNERDIPTYCRARQSPTCSLDLEIGMPQTRNEKKSAMFKMESASRRFLMMTAHWQSRA